MFISLIKYLPDVKGNTSLKKVKLVQAMTFMSSPFPLKVRCIHNKRKLHKCTFVLKLGSFLGSLRTIALVHTGKQM